MSTAFTPKVNPALLVWTRRTAGLNLAAAAKRIRVSEDALKAWEEGAAVPTIGELRRASEAYKRPLAIFMLPEPPREWSAIHDYRKLPEEIAGEGPSPALLAELRRAEERREIAIEILEDGEEPPAFPVIASVAEDPEDVADRIRAALGVSIDEQQAWDDKHEASHDWIRAVERLGVLVFQASRIPLSEMRGVSISFAQFPIVLINGADAARGRIFSMLHEVTHLALRQGGVCLFHDSDATEVFCNHVAGAILIPARSILADPLLTRRRRGPGVWTDAEIRRLARRFSASEEATLRRLVILGYASESFYTEKREEYKRAYESHREKLKEREGGPPYEVLVVRNVGESFARAVFSAYYERRLSLREVSAALNVKVKYLPKIEEKLWPRRVTRG